MNSTILNKDFFARDASAVAIDLLDKIICSYYQDTWLMARIIETEAYYLHEKGSHASLGFTEKRKALFMLPGTIYMYYARGGDSLNISCLGEGNAVLIKSAIPHRLHDVQDKMLMHMQQLNPNKNGMPRPWHKLCAGQTLLCKALNLKVPEWNQKNFDPQRFYIRDEGYRCQRIIQTTRLGIPPGRDEHLWLRFIDTEFAEFCTSNPLRKKHWQLDTHYQILLN